jgi:hypothetical protein
MHDQLNARCVFTLFSCSIAPFSDQAALTQRDLVPPSTHSLAADVLVRVLLSSDIVEVLPISTAVIGNADQRSLTVAAAPRHSVRIAAKGRL